MKKLVVVLLLIGIALPVLANDALVLPEGVLRVYTVPVLGFQTATFDEDGERKDAKDSATDPPLDTLFNLGVAGEYGLTDQISLGLQWAPGYNLYGDLGGKDNAYSQDIAGIPGTSPFSFLNGYSFSDERGGALFEIDEDGEVTAVDTQVGKDAQLVGATTARLGTEIQVLGNQGYVPNEQFRIQVALGGEIGGWQRDWKEEGKNFAKGNSYVDPLAYISGVDPRFRVGGSLSFDYVVTDGFYINAFSEYEQTLARKYDVTDFYKEAGVVADVASFEDLGAAADSTFAYFEGDEVDTVKIDVAPSYVVTNELEFTYQKQVSDLMRLGGSLPITLTLDSAVEADIDAEIDTTRINNEVTEATVKDYKLDKSGYTLTVTPTVDIFLNGLGLPTQFLVKYGIPVAGQNASAVQTVVIEGRVYLAF